MMLETGIKPASDIVAANKPLRAVLAALRQVANQSGQPFNDIRSKVVRSEHVSTRRPIQTVTVGGMGVGSTAGPVDLVGGGAAGGSATASVAPEELYTQLDGALVLATEQVLALVESLGHKLTLRELLTTDVRWKAATTAYLQTELIIAGNSSHRSRVFSTEVNPKNLTDERYRAMMRFKTFLTRNL